MAQATLEEKSLYILLMKVYILQAMEQKEDCWDPQVNEFI